MAVNPELKPWIAALPGCLMGEYRLGLYRGGGQFGLIFEAEHVTTGAVQAVKVLPPLGDADAVNDFANEGELLQKLLRCSGVIGWLETSSDMVPMTLQGLSVRLEFKYHVLTLASATLSELTLDPSRLARVPWTERISHWRDAVKAVHQMHLKSVAHRDLKADNCLLMVSGSQTALRVADLGRSKDFTLPPLAHPAAYISGRGDRSIAPPEFLWHQGGNSESDMRNADLYGLGSLFTELATGHSITALAIGSWQDALHDGMVQLATGRRRDLATLVPQYRRAISDIVDSVPPPIRQQVDRLLTQLCHPVPSGRPLQTAGKQRRREDGLNWLIRRADIMTKLLEIADRQPPTENRSRRSAS